MNDINLLEKLRETLNVSDLETVVGYDTGTIPENCLIIECHSEDNDSTMPTKTHTICTILVTIIIDPVGDIDIEDKRAELLDIIYQDTFLEDLRDINPAYPVYIYGYEFINDEMEYTESNQSYQINLKFWTSSAQL